MQYPRSSNWQDKIDAGQAAEERRVRDGSSLAYQLAGAQRKHDIEADSRLLSLIIRGTSEKRAAAIAELRPGKPAGSVYICRNRCYWKDRLWKETSIVETNALDVPRHFELISEGPQLPEGGESVLNVLINPSKPGYRHRPAPAP